jgi:hypothetical protein
MSVDVQGTYCIVCTPVAGQRPRDKKEPLLSNGFINKHVPTETVQQQQLGAVFSVGPVPKCYKRDKSGAAVELSTGK